MCHPDKKAPGQTLDAAEFRRVSATIHAQVKIALLILNEGTRGLRDFVGCVQPRKLRWTNGNAMIQSVVTAG